MSGKFNQKQRLPTLDELLAQGFTCEKRSRGDSIYKNYPNQSAVFVAPDGRITLTREIYEYLGRPLYIRIVRLGNKLFFVASDDKSYYKVAFGGNHHKSSASPMLHCSKISRENKLNRAGYKSVYQVIYGDQYFCINIQAPPIDYIEHK